VIDEDAAKQAGRNLILQSVLVELGNSAEAIAAKLAEAGVTGRRNDAHTCPVANFLVLKGFTSPTVCTFTVTAENGGKSMLASTPEPLIQFLAAFDGGAFESLKAAA
jgi:hypothetical protein